MKNHNEAVRTGADAIISWDKQLRAENTPCYVTVRPIHSFNPS